VVVVPGPPDEVVRRFVELCATTQMTPNAVARVIKAERG